MKNSTLLKLAPALLKSQREMGAVTKDAKNPFYKSTYADINSVLDVAIPVLNNNGIVVLQPVHSTPEGHYIETVLIHESSEQLSSEPMRLELVKSDPQGQGSAITYARRYQLQSLLGLRAEDDDGEKSMNRTQTKSQSKPAPTTVQLVGAPTVLNNILNAAASLNADPGTMSGTLPVSNEAPSPIPQGTLAKKSGFASYTPKRTF